MKKWISCYLKNQLKSCNKEALPKLIKFVEASRQELFDAKKEYDNLVKKTLQINDISFATLVNFQFPDFTFNLNAFYNIENGELSKCQFDPKTCTDQFEALISEIESIQVEFKQLRIKYEQISELIENLKNYYEKQLNSDDIYCKFGIDRSDQLMCLVYNFNVDISKVNTLYVYYGSRFNTRMFLNYNAMGQLFISDFKSDISRQGHGTFVLEELPIIVDEINNRIKKNKYCNILQTDIIPLITGEIVPDNTISEEELIRFYSKHGYITNNILYKRVP
ncbi:hypothetical protein COC52_24900 [Priestia megaterium]|uniref:hypothetical protein n=1 Tax=Priestia megaterium TaxID=1404 RepID=UPI000BFE22BC|nr:hypothetical protein [Priestia megaterium]PGR23035.1 hypothetical protein COC52_24900 [Priestia megaterium]